MQAFKVLSLDPGGSTGWAMFEWNGHNYNFDGGTFSIQEHHTLIDNLIRLHHPDLVIMESFDYRQASDRERKGLELVSREYIGVGKLVCSDTEIPFRLQPPPYKDTRLVRDDNLQKLGVFRAPPYPNRHYHDAMKHLIHYLVQTMRFQPIITEIRKK